LLAVVAGAGFVPIAMQFLRFDVPAHLISYEQVVRAGLLPTVPLVLLGWYGLRFARSLSALETGQGTSVPRQLLAVPTAFLIGPVLVLSVFVAAGIAWGMTLVTRLAALGGWQISPVQSLLVSGGVAGLLLTALLLGIRAGVRKQRSRRDHPTKAAKATDVDAHGGGKGRWKMLATRLVALAALVSVLMQSESVAGAMLILAMLLTVIADVLKAFMPEEKAYAIIAPLFGMLAIPAVLKLGLDGIQASMTKLELPASVLTEERKWAAAAALSLGYGLTAVGTRAIRLMGDPATRGRGVALGIGVLTTFYLAFVVAYSREVYPLVPTYLGGGRITPVAFWVSKDDFPPDLAPCRTPMPGWCGSLVNRQAHLLFADSSHLVLSEQATPGGRTFVVARDKVKALVWVSRK
jgi:hypothetical protein